MFPLAKFVDGLSNSLAGDTAEESSGEASRNFLLGISSGVLLRLGHRMLHVNMVLALLVKELGGSNTLVGLLPGLSMGAMRLPQLVVAGRIRHRERKLPFYVWPQVARAVVYGFIALAFVYLGAERPGLMLGGFFVLFTVTRVLAGIGSVPRLDVLAKAISAPLMGRFWAQRNLWGGVAGLAASLVVGYILGQRSGLGFPANYATLLGLAAVLCGLGAVCFSRIVEPIRPVARRPVGLVEQLNRVPRILRREENYRRYMLVRLLFSGGGMAGPFYIVFAREVLGAPLSMVGMYLPALTISGLVSNIAWARMAEREGVRPVLQWAALARMAAPLMALGLPALTVLVAGTQEPAAHIFVLVFVLQGAAMSGQMIGANSYLLLIAPERSRTIYLGLTNTLLALGSVLPLFGGIMSERLGYGPVFLLSATALAMAFVQTLGLESPEGEG